jgi:dihydrolipoamide dehydrogenase
LKFDWNKIIRRSREVSEKGTSGVDYLFRRNKIDSLRGEASLERAGQVNIKFADGKEETHSAANILIATGCVARPMPGLPFNGKNVIGSKEAVVLEKLPGSMIIVGAGAIGIEFAYIFDAFGVKVTVVEMLPNILPVEDVEVSQALEKLFAKQGIQILTNRRLRRPRRATKGSKLLPRTPMERKKRWKGRWRS